MINNGRKDLDIRIPKTLNYRRPKKWEDSSKFYQFHMTEDLNPEDLNYRDQIFTYASQKRNIFRIQMDHLREKVRLDPNNHYTYSESYLSGSVAQCDTEEALQRITRTEAQENTVIYESLLKPGSAMKNLQIFISFSLETDTKAKYLGKKIQSSQKQDYTSETQWVCEYRAGQAESEVFCICWEELAL